MMGVEVGSWLRDLGVWVVWSELVVIIVRYEWRLYKIGVKACRRMQQLGRFHVARWISADGIV
jgi:hypothetical protein